MNQAQKFIYVGLLDLLVDQLEALAPAVRHYLECGKTKKTN